jgi:hypothetical protein
MLIEEEASCFRRRRNGGDGTNIENLQRFVHQLAAVHRFEFTRSFFAQTNDILECMLLSAEEKDDSLFLEELKELQSVLASANQALQVDGEKDSSDELKKRSSVEEKATANTLLPMAQKTPVVAGPVQEPTVISPPLE